MTASRRSAPRSVSDWAIAVVIGLSVGALLLIGLVLYIFRYSWIAVEGKKFQQGQVRLLSETGHHALLAACRELSRRIAAGELKPGHYRMREDPPHPEASRFPRVILDLEPREIIIRADGLVLVELGVFVDACGVMAYPEDYRCDPHQFTSDDIQLVPGLWYYDDGYGKFPQYDKRIDALIEEGKERSAREGQATGVPN